MQLVWFCAGFVGLEWEARLPPGITVSCRRAIPSPCHQPLCRRTSEIPCGRTRQQGSLGGHSEPPSASTENLEAAGSRQWRPKPTGRWPRSVGGKPTRNAGRLSVRAPEAARQREIPHHAPCERGRSDRGSAQLLLRQWGADRNLLSDRHIAEEFKPVETPRAGSGWGACSPSCSPPAP